MLSKAQMYRELIQKTTQRRMLFPNEDSQGKTPTTRPNCNIRLPSSYPFRSSQQIGNNISQITHQITNQIQKQDSIKSENEWPQSCIGLVLCEYHQNNQIYYVYGTGTLIHQNIVLTSAQNVYCRLQRTQYKNIKFITGVVGNKCSGIYNVKIVNFPNEYIMQQYQNYNFAVLQLYDDLSDNCGYIRWKSSIKPADKKLIAYGYLRDKKGELFNLRQITKHIKQGQSCWEGCSGTGLLIKQEENKYSIVGLHNIPQGRGYIVLNQKIRNMINQWTYLTTINLSCNNIDAQGCKYLSQTKWIHLKWIYLSFNNICAQGCKYLSQTNWKYLNSINLCNYMMLLQANNIIDAQGCKYLSQVSWIHLKWINLSYNNIQNLILKLLLKRLWPNAMILNDT